jgi:tRNA A-37 threonylcarbamoyl transferase component Bud32/dienelactone hydrolase
MTEIIARLTAALADRYRIESELGAGGMATVYLAEDLKHKRSVAVKVLRPELAAALGAERFLREIEITAGLTHPHILPVLDSGEADGFFFYVMPFVEGESLRDRLSREGQLSLEDALSITEEVGEALESAHNHGVVHRDIKPDNILLVEGRVYVADFGIARAVTAAGGEKLTATGMAIGTPAYMSPEQAVGAEEVDHRTDIFALGCVLYEMLAGEPPHSGPTAQAVIAKVIADSPTRLSTVRDAVPPNVETAVHTALAKATADRFSSIGEMLQALKATARPAVPRSSHLAARVAGAAVLLVGLIVAFVFATRSSEQPTLEELRAAVAGGDWEEAYRAAARMDPTDVPDSLWPAFTATVTIVSEPTGATVHRRPYHDADPNAWVALGTTPLTIERFPGGPSVLRLEADGYRTAYAGYSPMLTDPIVLDPVETVAEEWRNIVGDLPAYVGGPEFAFRYQAPNLSLAPTVRLADFQISRYEVTNAKFKQFIEAGGYEDQSYWEHLFERDGRTLSWEDAMALFTDSTGRRGPSTWTFGTYRDGRDDFPVTGISWYEAAAYARFAGTELPTVYHWFRAATTELSDWIIPASNLQADGPQPVGTNLGMSQFGMHDMAGNAREWVYNESGNERFILGGGWADAPYVFTVANAAPPFDRSPMNGFRLAKYSTDAADFAITQRPIDRPERDFTRETPVADDMFAVYQRLYAYDDAPLRSTIHTVDTADVWIREYLTFDAAYGNERVGLYLYLPRTGTGPLQTVVYFPGSNALWSPSFDQYSTDHAAMIVRSGRAFAFPVYQSTFDREDGFVYRRQDETNTYRDHVVHWAKDLGRTIDYLETRAEIDADKLGFLGNSWGGMLAPIMLVTEPRLKVAVLGVPGLSALPTQPEVDAFHFVSRATQPVLMLSGEYDMIHPLASSAQPMFDLWGALPDQKRHVIVERGHLVPYYMMVQETLAWLDRFLGPA